MLHGASLIASLESVRERRAAQPFQESCAFGARSGTKLFSGVTKLEIGCDIFEPPGNARSAKEPASCAFVDLRRDLIIVG